MHKKNSELKQEIFELKTLINSLISEKDITKVAASSQIKILEKSLKKQVSVMN